MFKILRLAVVAVLLTSALQTSKAEVGAAFTQGRSRLSLGGGYGSFNNHSYGVVGIGAGYYVLDGLEAGVDGEAWLGDKPHIYTISPEVRYIVTQMQSFKPYLGAFYKRTFYDTLDNTNSFGGRAGFISPVSEHAYLSAGLVFEHINNCNKNLYDDCSLVYPELGISLSY